MTEFEPRHKGMRLTAIIVLIALVVGIGGGWLIGVLTGGSNDTPGSVYITTADGGSLITDGDSTLLTLTAVGNTVAKVDTQTRAAEPTDAAEFFEAWNDTFGDDARSAVVTATGPDGDVQLVLELTNAEFSQIGYVVEFDATVVSGADTARDLSNVTLIIDAD
ncbi:hypothetical protein [Demequina sp.]|uniref:hypothetical protein n=1 Tax=Demequina sp. TaxID=2050685 RepID=UPI003D0F622E